MTTQTKTIAGTAGAIAIAFATYLATGRVDCSPESLEKLHKAANKAAEDNDADDFADVERKYQVLVKVCAEQSKPIPPIPSAQESKKP